MNLIKVLQKNFLLILLIATLSGNIYSQVHWDKYENNPIINVGASGTWESNLSGLTSVIYHYGIYEVWLSGTDDNGIGRIGYATSTDGINWEKYIGNPVLDLGAVGTWDESEVMHPSVVYDGSTYHMWYNGYGQNVQRTGYATSPDGINWTKYSGNPVLTIGNPGTWDDYMLALLVMLFLILYQT